MESREALRSLGDGAIYQETPRRVTEQPSEEKQDATPFLTTHSQPPSSDINAHASSATVAEQRVRVPSGGQGNHQPPNHVANGAQANHPIPNQQIPGQQPATQTMGTASAGTAYHFNAAITGANPVFSPTIQGPWNQTFNVGNNGNSN